MSIISTKKTSLFVSPNETLPTPPAGFIETTDAVIPTPEFTSVDINRLTGKMNTKDSVVDLCRVKTSFDAKMNMRSNDVGGSALSNPPEYGLLLKCAGFDETIDTATAGQETVTYSNNNEVMPTVSALVYLDDNKLSMTNSLVCGTKIDMKIGEPATVTNTFQGYLDDAKGVKEVNPAVTLTEEPILIVSCADVILLDGTCLPIESATIAMNEVVADLYTMGGSCGLKKNLITDYALTLELGFFVDKDSYGREASLIESGQAKAVVIKLGLDKDGNFVNGKSVEIKCDIAKADKYSDSSNNDMLSRTLTLRLFDGSSPAVQIKNGFFA